MGFLEETYGGSQVHSQAWWSPSAPRICGKSDLSQPEEILFLLSRLAPSASLCHSRFLIYVLQQVKQRTPYYGYR